MPKIREDDASEERSPEEQYPQAESCPHYGTPSNYRPGDDPHPVM